MVQITVHELKEKLESGKPVHVIDVREEWEFQEYNIGGRLIPLSALMSRVDELEELRNEEVILHCKAGSRSLQAAMILEQMGFSKVVNVAGGIEEWKRQFAAQPE